MFGMITRSRAFSTEALKVVNNVAKQQFTVSLRGVDAVLAYEQNGKQITLVRTDVPPVFQGKGVGKLLAKNAFIYCKDQNLEVTCKCHFLAKYYQDNLKDFKTLKIKLDLE